MVILLAVFLACLASSAECKHTHSTNLPFKIQIKIFRHAVTRCGIMRCTLAGDDDNMVRPVGGHRQQWDSSENMNESSSKITLKLCFRYFLCRPLKKTCYCCQTLPKNPCFWGRQDCLDACPGNTQTHQPLQAAPAPTPAGRQLQAHSGVTPASPTPAQKFLL